MRVWIVVVLSCLCAATAQTADTGAARAPAVEQAQQASTDATRPAAEPRAPASQPRPAASLFDRVAAQARDLAAAPYRNVDNELPPALRDLDYQSYRDIRFRKDRALWSGSDTFSVEFFHPGFLYRHPVAIREVVDGQVRPVKFQSGMFEYGPHARLDQLPEDLGFAGFRVHYPVHDSRYKDELIAFLGASYFRVVGRGQHYGLSARGLAVDTAVPTGEEFPRFEAFWLVRPKPGENVLRFYALLDSPSVTGAYEFALTSGVDTVLDVRTRLFARSDVERLGVAPLTSMFAWGENGGRSFDDYRPEVHDSDGLLQLRGSGEWIWRPLTNPPELQVSALLDRMPQGFGLLQRDRAFDNYQDAEARYDRRPGLWVTPGAGDWGSGAVQLVEIPTADETNDNIVAFWVADEPFEAGDVRNFQYRMRTVSEFPNPEDLAQVSGTRIGWGWVPGAANPPPHSLRQFVVDFEGGELEGLAANQPVQAALAVHRGEAKDLTISRLPETGAWRVAFKLAPAVLEQTADMRLYLTLRGRRISETWSYVWNPAQVQQS